MNFTDKATYLAAVAVWKHTYAALTIDIRKSKAIFKEAHRASSKAGPYNWHWKLTDVELAANALAEAALRSLDAARSDRYILRTRASAMITERHEGKATAAGQYSAVSGN